MANDLPTRDARPEGLQGVAGNNLVDFAGNGEDTTSRDVPVEGPSLSSSPTYRQGYTLTNTSGPEAISPSERDTVSITFESTVASRSPQIIDGDPQRFALHTTFSPSYDQGHMLPYDYDPRGAQPGVSNWGEQVSHPSVTQLSTAAPPIFPFAALHPRRPNDSDVYPLPGRPPDSPQLDPDSQAPLPPSQNDALAFSELSMPTVVTFDNDTAFSNGYDEGRGVRDHDFRPPTLFTSTPPPPAFGSMSEGPYTAPVFPHDTLCQQNDPPTEGFYHFEPEQPSPVRAQIEDPHRTPFSSHTIEDGSRRYGEIRASFSTPLLTPRAELEPSDEQYELHHTPLIHEDRTQNDAGPSGSRAIASGDFPGDVQDPRKRKRKRNPEEVGGAARSRPRTRKNAPSGDSQNTQPTTRPRIKIKQPPYVCGNPQPRWVQQPPIEFVVNGQPGIRLTDALDPYFSGLEGMHDKMFQYAGVGSSVSCRIHFPGNPAQSSQITTTDHKKTHNPRTRKKLASEVAKSIQRNVEKLKIDMRCEYMVLTKLFHVSKASWRPEIWYEQNPAGDS